MYYSNLNFDGLSAREVQESRDKNGWNRADPVIDKKFRVFVKRIGEEPMLLLLLAASVVYFIHGDTAEGIFLAVAIVLVSSISFYQESRSKKALKALRAINQPTATVIRDRQSTNIPIEEVVVGDYLISEEGTLIAADGLIVQANDFAVNESIVTGESLAVYKDTTPGKSDVYQGTYVVSGLAICRVTHIGSQTKIGKIGTSLQTIRAEHSPLQDQITSFVGKMAGAGVLVFIVMWVISYIRTTLILESLLQALTIAMSILPEEIPVAFATFMSIGAWRLTQLGIIVKRARTVETLGAATVICVDKTGTITKNDMRLAKVYVHSRQKIFECNDAVNIRDVISFAMWASEPIPFDPMEKEIHKVYTKVCIDDRRPQYKLYHEYPLSGKPPIMTHIFRNTNGNEIIAAKGAPEAFLTRSMLSDEERQHVQQVLKALAEDGYRVLGVGEAHNVKPYPSSQDEFTFDFKGIIAFYDPPKENIKSVLNSFYRAGVDVKIITGDYPATTARIGSQIELRNSGNIITGEQLMKLSDDALSAEVKRTSIFARMFPEAKLKIIEALKKQNQIVAMTGDGINDGPALKAAHIGIAMGKKGTEIAKQASSLILADDDLQRMVDAIAVGRRIYNNLKKAIQYIISIHIPIILIVFIPLVLGWVFPLVFTPVHVIFLELVMGPTCSIVYENEPIEKNLMTLKPRPYTTTFFTFRELSLSILQGLIITVGLVAVYWISIDQGNTAQKTTSMVFVSLIAANITLTLVNRSFYYSVLDTLTYRNNLVPIVIFATIAVVAFIFILPPFRDFFGFEWLKIKDVLYSISIGFLSVIWLELFKFFKRIGIAQEPPTFHHGINEEN